MAGSSMVKGWESLSWNAGCRFAHDQYVHFLNCTQLRGGNCRKEPWKKTIEKGVWTSRACLLCLCSFACRDPPLHYLSLCQTVCFSDYSLMFIIKVTEVRSQLQLPITNCTTQSRMLGNMVEDETWAVLATCIQEPRLGIVGMQTAELRWTHLTIWLQFWCLGPGCITPPYLN